MVQMFVYTILNKFLIWIYLAPQTAQDIIHVRSDKGIYALVSLLHQIDSDDQFIFPVGIRRDYWSSALAYQ